MDKSTTYTQVIDDKTGEIKYVPNVPPQQPPPPAGSKPPVDSNHSEETQQEVMNALKAADTDINEELTQTLEQLMANNKKLRYNRRLEAGKLDSRSLVNYKTSKRLFKKRAIHDKKYQFTFLIDTSGSMLGHPGQDESEEASRINIATSAVACTVQALEELGVRSSVFGMNCAFHRVKDFEEDFDANKFRKEVYANIVGAYNPAGDLEDTEHEDNAGGTSEGSAYRETVKYLTKNTPPKTQNVVIVISDGEPGFHGSKSKVTMGEDVYYVDVERSENSITELSHYWSKFPQVLTYGLGIGGSAARQVPNNKRINNINELPEVMGDLLTGLML